MTDKLKRGYAISVGNNGVGSNPAIGLFGAFLGTPAAVLFANKDVSQGSDRTGHVEDEQGSAPAGTGYQDPVSAV